MPGGDCSLAAVNARDGAMTALRVFYAIVPSDEVIDDIGTLQWGPSGVRWTLPDQVHLTLRFLGAVPMRAVEALVSDTRPLAAAPCTLQLQGVGHAPPRGAAKVLWAGVRDEAPLHALRGALDKRLQAQGFGPTSERRRPHVTVGRVRRGDDAALADWLSGHGLYRSAPFAVRAVELWRSELRPEGSEFTRLGRMLLAAG